MRIMGGLLASAYLRTVFLWMPNSLAIARMERPRSLACCTAFHRTLCRGVGFLRGDAGGLRTLPPPFNVAPVGLDDAEGCQALLGVVAHAVDPTVKAGAISERTIGGTENSRARRRLLRGDRASPVLHEELTVQALMDLQLLQHPFLGHAFAPDTVSGRPAAAGAVHAGADQDAAHRRAAQVDPREVTSIGV